MSEQVQYRVKRKIKYSGRWYRPGDVWQPAGGKYDAQIIRNRLVVTERLPAAKEPAAADAPDAVAVPEPQMAPPPVEAARSDRRRAKTVEGPEPRPGSGSA